MIVTVTFKIQPEDQAALARVHKCERYEVGEMILEPFLRQAVQDAFARVRKSAAPARATTMTIIRKRGS